MDNTEHFEILAEEISFVCGTDFEIGIIDGHIDKNYMDHSITCVNHDGTETKHLLDSSKRRLIFNTLCQIQIEMQANGREKWTGYQFQINKNGTFKFNVSYDKEW